MLPKRIVSLEATLSEGLEYDERDDKEDRERLCCL